MIKMKYEIALRLGSIAAVFVRKSWVFSAVAGFLLLAFSCRQSQPSAFSPQLKVTVLGGAGQVSGSMTLVESSQGSFLVDCGLFYPDGSQDDIGVRQSQADKKNSSLGIDAKSVRFVLLTHAHLDHSGRLPLLVREGFDGKIFCTPATLLLLEEMLSQQVRYENTPRQWVHSTSSIKQGEDGSSYVTAHWNQCEWQDKIASRNMVSGYGMMSDVSELWGLELSPCKSCAKKDVDSVLMRTVSIGYGEEIEFMTGIKATFYDAGHIPGSASILVEVSQSEGKSKRLLFSGDIGNNMSILQDGPLAGAEADAVWLESTYGGHCRDLNVESEIERFQSEVADVLARGGIAWIPAFALDRTQKVLYLLAEAKSKGIIQNEVKIFCPSPTAESVTKIYQQEILNRNSWFRQGMYALDKPFADHICELPRPPDSSFVLITTSGMMDAAFSVDLMQKLLPDSGTTVFLVGYQDPGTPGGQLRHESSVVEWQDQAVEVLAKVSNYSFFSAHADAVESLSWLGNQDKQGVLLYLVHGDGAALESNAIFLRQNGFQHVEIAKPGEPIDFSVP